MADVRLTATNPEDSSVVPVACDASGRLLLEEQGQGPPGPEGPPGPKGDDGDPFSGNFADDVTFGGSAEFASNIASSSYVVSNRDEGDGTICEALLGSSNGAFPGAEGYGLLVREKGASAGLGCFISRGGDIEASNSIVVNKGNGAKGNVELTRDGTARFGTNAESKITLTGSNGSVTFANNKAGFTSEGYLWCTTRRGDIVVLDATSNGLGSWVEYSPPSRIDDLRDRLDAFRPETGEMPADTP